jgi:hypothetical protein
MDVLTQHGIHLLPDCTAQNSNDGNEIMHVLAHHTSLLLLSKPPR